MYGTITDAEGAAAFAPVDKNKPCYETDRYGYREHHLSIRAVIRPEEIILRLRDDCRKFDLTERYRMVDPEDPAENIGLRLIFAAADDVSYSSALDLNNVCIRISR